MLRSVALTLAAAVMTACGGGDTVSRAADAGPPAAAAPHGDHTPKFGGVVLMNGDLHFEVILDRSGRHRVYFSDATRNPLPASSAADVAMTVQRPGEAPEQLGLQIDERDESWIAQGTPVAAAGATARISYAWRGRPYWIDLPFDGTAQAVPDPHQKR